jgi:hypothetical protein
MVLRALVKNLAWPIGISALKLSTVLRKKNEFVLNFLEKSFFSLFLFLSAKKDFYLKLLKTPGASTTKLFAVVIYYFGSKLVCSSLHDTSTFSVICASKACYLAK